MDVDLYLII